MTKINLALLTVFLVTLTGCASSSGVWGWYVIDPSTKSGLTNIKFLLGGFAATIQLSITFYIFGASCGFARYL